MRAIILAAGKGERLNGTTPVNHPKCLLKIGDASLIEWQLAALKAAGVEDITVVVGCGADEVRRVCGTEVRFRDNRMYRESNSLYSLWLAKDLLVDGFVVLNADVLFPRQLLNKLLHARAEDALLVAYRDEMTPPFGEEEMKVKVQDGLVVDISKDLPPEDADGENVGIAKFGKGGARTLMRHLDELISAGLRFAWAPRAFRSFAAERALHAVSTGCYPWTEIDFPEDYRRALDEVLPAIMSLDADRPSHQIG